MEYYIFLIDSGSDLDSGSISDVTTDAQPTERANTINKGIVYIDLNKLCTHICHWISLYKIRQILQGTNRFIRSRKSKNNKQCNGQRKQNKRLNNYLQNITHTTKDRVTGTSLEG